MRRMTCLMLTLTLIPISVNSAQARVPELLTVGADLSADQREMARFLKAQNIQSFPQYVSWFEKHMRYRPDGSKDSWARPVDTLIRQQGDCEDLAFLNKEMLTLFGIEGRVLGTKKDDEHHVFLVFTYRHQIYVFDNTRCIKTKAKSIEEIAAFLYRKYAIEYLLEVNHSPKNITVLFDKFTLEGYAQLSDGQPAG